jgi:hypothetical protein
MFFSGALNPLIKQKHGVLELSREVVTIRSRFRKYTSIANTKWMYPFPIFHNNFDVNLHPLFVS